MKMMRLVATSAAIMFLAGSILAAEEGKADDSSPAGSFGVSAKVGTLGLGGEFTAGLGRNASLRLGVNGANANPDLYNDEGKVMMDMEWLTYSGLLDLHPAGGGFRFSLGAMINKNKLNMTADINKAVEVDDQEFILSDFSGQVTFNQLAPYIGIGYGNAAMRDGRWHFSCDFGVMYQGSPKVEAQGTVERPNGISQAQYDQLQAEFDARLNTEVDKIENDVSGFKFYPVISIGCSFRF